MGLPTVCTNSLHCITFSHSLVCLTHQITRLTCSDNNLKPIVSLSIMSAVVFADDTAMMNVLQLRLLPCTWTHHLIGVFCVDYTHMSDAYIHWKNGTCIPGCVFVGLSVKFQMKVSNYIRVIIPRVFCLCTLLACLWLAPHFAGTNLRLVQVPGKYRIPAECVSMWNPSLHCSQKTSYLQMALELCQAVIMCCLCLPISQVRPAESIQALQVWQKVSLHVCQH